MTYPTDITSDFPAGPGRGWAAGRERRHTWPCRHCGMVEDYRLLRDAQLRQAEGVYGQDEDYRLITFHDWLRAYQWETDTTADATGAANGSVNDVAVVVPTQRTNSPIPDAITAARAAVAAIPAPIDELPDDTAPPPLTGQHGHTDDEHTLGIAS